MAPLSAHSLEIASPIATISSASTDGIPSASVFELSVQSSVLPTGLTTTTDFSFSLTLRPQAASSAVSISADLLAPGNWDSHKDNDENQTSNWTQLTEGLDYIWDLAEAAGVADQLLVVVGSDFSRTTFCNAENGKDHWSTDSYLVMEKNGKYANKTIGATDKRHNALTVDPVTLEPSTFGTKIFTSHVHEALRKHLGLANTATANIFPFNNTEQFNFFS